MPHAFALRNERLSMPSPTKDYSVHSPVFVGSVHGVPSRVLVGTPLKLVDVPTVVAHLVSPICMVEISQYHNHPGLLLLHGKINGSVGAWRSLSQEL